MLGIIGGTGLTQLANLEITHRQVARTPYGEPSGALTFGRICGQEVIFLARHGYGHTIPPHEVNYRANLWALKDHGVDRVVSVATVGGIHPELIPGMLVIPDQIIDYTHGTGCDVFSSKAASRSPTSISPSPIAMPCAQHCCRPRPAPASVCATAACTGRRRDRAWKRRQKSTAWSATAPTWWG